MAQRPAVFAPQHTYTGVIMQQGRVALDGDANTAPSSWPARIRASFGHGLSIKSGPTPQAYVSVRRLTQQIEHALYSRLAWAAFAPNGPPLWTQLRVAAANYLMGLYQSGVLVGSTPDQAFFVRCGPTTMTQVEISNGQVNVIVGFAPIYPAEFVLLVIGLMAGS